jgi:hypothetical protein
LPEETPVEYLSHAEAQAVVAEHAGGPEGKTAAAANTEVASTKKRLTGVAERLVVRVIHQMVFESGLALTSCARWQALAAASRDAEGKVPMGSPRERHAQVLPTRGHNVILRCHFLSL